MPRHRHRARSQLHSSVLAAPHKLYSSEGYNKLLEKGRMKQGGAEGAQRSDSRPQLKSRPLQARAMKYKVVATKLSPPLSGRESSES